MKIDVGIAQNFLAKIVNTACCMINRCLIKSILNKTPYDLMTKKKPKLRCFKTFGYKCFVLNNRKNDIGKFNPRNDDRVFVVYSPSSKSYKIYNKRTQYLQESVHVVFYKVRSASLGHSLNDADLEGPLNVSRNSTKNNDKLEERIKDGKVFKDQVWLMKMKMIQQNIKNLVQLNPI